MNFYLYNHPTDMRKGFDGLSGIIVNKTSYEILSGDVFIFINKYRNKMKLLRWESGGLVLYYKRLEQGTFEVLQIENNEFVYKVEYHKLVMLIAGINTNNITKRKRYKIT
ncbi:MAG: IS66 family insertion sequence element accessory protein TnpB [Methylomarinum sp.]|nr:IS66 family insertion sequence element accessory protein TnpB [Methylomarinum sp.]